MKKIKVIHILSRLDRGGAELRILESLDFYKNINFHFLLLSGKKGELDKKFIEKGATLHYIKLRSLLFPFLFLKIINNNNINIVHSHIFFSSAYIVLLTKLFSKAKTISHFRTASLPKQSLFYKIRSNIFKSILLKFSDKVLFVSETSKKQLFGKEKSNKLKVIYNGINMMEIKNNLKREERLIHVGRFNKAKNQLFLLDVIKQLSQKNINTKIHFFGDVDTAYGNEFKKKELSNQVIIEGVVQNIPVELMRSKLFLFPSIREGLPGSLIEACLCGCNVIASDIEENIEVQRYFPEQITILPLQEELWTEKIEEILKKESEPVLNFENLPFTIEGNVSKVSTVYRDLISKGIRGNDKNEW